MFSGPDDSEEPDLHEVDIASLHAAPPATPVVPEPASEPEKELHPDFEDAEEQAAYEAAYEDARQRRRNVRINIRCPVTVRIEGYEPMRSRARDMSATGVGFSTRLPLELDMTGRVTIHFQDWQFTKEFVVRFARPIIAGKHVGVEFRELSQEEHERIVKEVFALQRSALRAERQANG